MPQFNPLASTFKAPNLPQVQGASATPAAPSADSGFSFHDLLSIINPLQHLPVISTLYRAITGDTIKTPEKIAGDALYGGLWGAIASVADSAFQSITGKSVGDTVLALLTGSSSHSASTAVAANSVAATPAAANAPAAATDPNIAALTTSLASKGVDSDLAQRAILAYQKSMTLPSMVLATAQ